jgi:hypothetical protein
VWFGVISWIFFSGRKDDPRIHTNLHAYGVRLSSITGSVELALSDNLNAQFEASSIVSNVLSDIPKVKLSTDGRSDFEAQIGSGITISSVRGGIRLRKLD